MRRNLISTVLLVCVGLVVGCSKSDADDINDIGDNMKKATSILKDVKDESTAKAAAPKLKSIFEDINKISKKHEGDKNPDESNPKVAAAKKYADEQSAEFIKEMMRVGTIPDAAAPLKEAFESMKDMK